MNKKSVLFTIVTIFLLSSIFLLTSSYVRRNKLHQDIVSEAAVAEKARFVQEDIVTDFLYLLDINLDEIVRSSTNITLKFENFSTVASNTSYDSYLESYETFIEGEFSNLTNTIITLKDFGPVFHFYPYNSTFKIEKRKFFLYVDDYDRLNYIDISIRTSDINASVTSEPTDDWEGCPELRLKVTDRNGDVIDALSPKTYVLDPEGEDQRIIIEYNTDVPKPNMTVEFGKHTERNPYGNDTITYGTLYVETNDIEAQIDKFHISYGLTNKSTVLRTNGTVYIE